ncbi:putative minor extracellular protease vpr protein [Phaeoacremonium minimum UCRPA7]|uniref:Putative minor extracellular protease vpr protein n=1 Tax=Phaeoacremonium minimum (strain UCR-PA7) TaxID=1286976 RepID=R8BDF0_PHAM7|nr:putative minor extracellular protease vpr protein [Phaeoacremonium minimum UCRPA7]EON97319.1 putative minor extracellular protease vpr protein [Phaeoacremonium minimum UCRPA7]
MTGVDKLHAAGITGKGAVVAVIDTGIYYPHPDIGGGFGPGFKVSGGYDYVGDGLWPDSGDKEPDDDPLDTRGHGTHVAGIIAGKGPWFTGVAPDATLLSYKVFSNAADVITASIGGPSGWSHNAWATVADRLVDAGVVVTISAGNNGDLGPFFASSAAESIVDAIKAGTFTTATFPEDTEFVGVPNTHPSWPSVFTSFGGTYDLGLKPDIAAPGTNIFSLYPGNAYAVMSGTSMACPYVAGVAALYIGYHGGRAVHGPGFAKQLSARILSSGDAVPWGSETGSGTFASAAQVGNGLVNATKVLNYNTELSFSKFALNDTHYFSRYHGVEITNNAAESVIYTFEIKPAGAFEAYWSKAADAYMAPRMKYQFEMGNKPLQITPNVKLPSGKFEVKPGETKKAE